MNTRSLVLPELLPFLEEIPTVDLSPESLPAFRDGLEHLAGQSFLQAEDYPVTLERLTIPATDTSPAIRLLSVRPRKEATAPRPALLHLHGGGYFSGQPELTATQLCQFAQDLDCVVLSPDYRLAPEHPFPAAIEDAYTTLCWITRNAETLGIDASRIGLTGESAGGGLAAGLALLTRDREGPTLLFQNLIYPMLDDRTIADQLNSSPVGGEFLWTRTSNTFAWTSLLNPVTPGSEDVSPYAAPARATDLSDLPPVYLSVGALDLFLDENLVYAQRLIHQGVSVELEIVPGACHVFDQTDTQVATRSIARRIDAMKRGFGL
ncbi:alpha/beta hydrolase [Gluconobacter sphaericus]|uniref:Esterase n=1 Tax=Gluconobacter sphaericus NBRC 12467 TaxID=1307951 RepID=A0AA37WDN6_9PROT|nr:alpha/beta hydrolase [Gluconobacter sphaericus]MBF0886243.1 alpha/beta hydrolase [Gluconobacter sphaericus]GBR50182.1 arylesterase [Gluconobacter sphaericus NBRC 12467]GEB43311.1 esterase [Gluconobacter sphaericus NBRC 12467]GLQ86349.1 esterase [Gluconobacter sphaericus NBRC 12467]